MDKEKDIEKLTKEELQSKILQLQLTVTQIDGRFTLNSVDKISAIKKQNKELKAQLQQKKQIHS